MSLRAYLAEPAVEEENQAKLSTATDAFRAAWKNSSARTSRYRTTPPWSPLSPGTG
ncbi:hypothetical protein [Streptomyces sp. NPDC046727]|uniref:hypothetical protein n=1 Tax=Streptomyces sp. NPDC046727 TaxID=3155373 RepID=UPI0033C60C9A